MKFSVWPINQQPLDDIIGTARHAEATGWDGVWMADHLMPSAGSMDLPMPECWTALALIASAVPRIRLGTLVMSATFRHPGVLAKMAATLASAHPGRLVLGLGAGWQLNEHVAFGLPFDTPANRLAALDESCAVVRQLLDHGECTFSGSHIALDGAVAHPIPSRRVPILLGVKGDRALRIVARHADEWNLWADPATFRERSEVLDRHCEALERDPESVGRSAQAVVAFTDQVPLDARWSASGLPMITGSPEMMRATLEEYRDAGLDELVVPDFALGRGTQRMDQLDRFLEEVAGPFRESASRGQTCNLEY